MSQLELDTVQPFGTMPQIWQGYVVDAPINQTAKIGVIIPDLHPEAKFTNVRWQARSGMTVPDKGDIVLCVFDNRRELWIIGVWPSTRDPIIYSGLIDDGPPPQPVDDDIWVASNVQPGVTWMFQYNGLSGSVRKWEFIGGAAFYVQGGSPTLNLNVPRGGDYDIRWSADCSSGGSWSDVLTVSSGTIVGGSGTSTVAATGVTANRQRLSGQARATGLNTNATIAHGISGQSAVNSAELAVTPVRIS